MKRINAIRAEADYDAALAEIQALWEATPGSPEAHRFEEIVALVEEYESKHYPIPPPDPVAARECAQSAGSRPHPC